MNVMKHSGKLDIDGNVFGRLINASIENEEEFDDDKVVGNLFIFFFAGVSHLEAPFLRLKWLTGVVPA